MLEGVKHFPHQLQNFAQVFTRQFRAQFFRLERIDLDVHGTNLRPLFISQHWRGDGKWQVIIFILGW